MMLGIAATLLLIPLSQEFLKAGAPQGSWFQTLGDVLKHAKFLLSLNTRETAERPKLLALLLMEPPWVLYRAITRYQPKKTMLHEQAIFTYIIPVIIPNNCALVFANLTPQCI